LEIEKSVVEFATEAALRYRAIAAVRHDNQVPESFLRSHVASRLHDRFDCPVHVDRLYAAMAIELGGPVTADLVTALGGHRADIAIYRDDRPFAVIELTVFDEVAPLPAIGVKLDKAKILARRAVADFRRRDDLPDRSLARGPHRAPARCRWRQHVCRRTPAVARRSVAMVLCLRFNRQLERFPAKWIPVRVKKTRQTKK
jgi:hypothetical protein